MPRGNQTHTKLSFIQPKIVSLQGVVLGRQYRVVVGHVQRLDVDPLSTRPGEKASGIRRPFGDHVSLKFQFENGAAAVAKHGVSWIVGEGHV